MDKRGGRWTGPVSQASTFKSLWQSGGGGGWGSSTVFLIWIASWLAPGSLVLIGSFSESSSCNCVGALWLNKWLAGSELLICPLRITTGCWVKTTGNGSSRFTVLAWTKTQFLADYSIGHLPFGQQECLIGETGGVLPLRRLRVLGQNWLADTSRLEQMRHF